MTDLDALAADLHQFGVCRDLSWGGGNDHAQPGPCSALAAHVLSILNVQGDADIRRAVAEEIAARCEGASVALLELALEAEGSNRTRLQGKWEGVLLAKSYADEEARIAREVGSA